MFALGGGTAGQDVDFLEVPASLVITDRLYGLKKEILDSVGLGEPLALWCLRQCSCR